MTLGLLLATNVMCVEYPKAGSLTYRCYRFNRLYVSEWIYAITNAFFGLGVSTLFIMFTPLPGLPLPLPQMVEYTAHVEQIHADAHQIPQTR